jgi:branched-chain amino acid transport system permease protein
LLGICVAGGFLALPAYAPSQDLDLAILVGIAGVGALGLGMLTGYAGQISIGQAGLLGVGGFVAGVTSTRLGWGFIPAVVLGACAGGVVGLILALPAARLRGLYLVLATLGFHYVAVYGVTEYQSYVNSTAALTGLTLRTPTLLGLKVDSYTKWFYLVAVIVAITYWYCHNVTRTRPGRAWVAMRDRDVVAAALGVNVVRAKVAAFVLSSVLASLSGVLLVYYNGAASAGTYTLTLAISYLVMVVVGGMGSNTGALLGALFVIGVPRLLTSIFDSVGFSAQVQAADLGPAQLFLFGMIMTAFLIFEPGGCVALVRRLARGRGVHVSTRVEPARERLEPARENDNAENAGGAIRRNGAELLVVEDLALVYQGVITAVRHVSLSVSKGEIVGLVGPNGAGKTSTLVAIAGLTRTMGAAMPHGQVWLGGKRIDSNLPHRVAESGLTLIPEGRNVFPNLRVDENLRASGNATRRKGAGMIDIPEVYELFPALAVRRGQLAGYLSGGERQMLAIAMALVGSPKVLLIDEMMLGLSPAMSNLLSGVVRRLRDELGLSMLVVEQNGELLRGLADYIYLMVSGEVIAHGEPGRLVGSDDLETAYLGATSRVTAATTGRPQ